MGRMQTIRSRPGAIPSCRAALVLLAFAIATPAAAEIFPDENLEAAVRQYVFEKRHTDEPITAEDVATISTITARSKGIRDLTGLEHCKRLMLLELPDNEVTDISPLAELSLLQSLTLTNNQVEDISPLSGLKRLQYIELSNNKVTDISALTELEAMNSAYLSGNRISDLTPVKGLSKLWTLDVADNAVVDVTPVGSLVRLSTLNVDGNSVKDLKPLAPLTSLQRLSLRNNQVSDIGVLVEMAEKDIAGDSRFARYWTVSLQGNPLSEESKNDHVKALSEYSFRIETADE